MKKVFSTDVVHPRDRFDFWHSVACATIVGHSSQPDCRATFNAEIEAGKLADIGIVRFENSAMSVSRTAKHVSQSQADELFVCQQSTGTLSLEQDGRQIVLTAGEATLLDPSMPYDAKFTSGSKLVVLKFPRRALEARIGTSRELIARSMTSSGPECAMMSSFISMLPRAVDNVPPATEKVIQNLTLDLVAVSMIRIHGQRKRRLSSARSLTLLNIRTVIEAKLHEPTLDPATVAAAAGVSLRYANSLLAEEDTSLGRLILSMRLHRCKMAMEDPLQNHRNISEIAYGWGFSDMTHFGRAFRAKYEMLPREFREMKRRERGS